MFAGKSASQRRRRWANIEPTLGESFVFAGNKSRLETITSLPEPEYNSEVIGPTRVIDADKLGINLHL